MSYIDRFIASYTECALWSTLAEDGSALISTYDSFDLSDSVREAFDDDCRAFVVDNFDDLAELLVSKRMTPEQAGHDFWLTRNRHGAGYWDRGIGDAGERLTDSAHAYGEFDLYVDDDVVHGA